MLRTGKWGVDPIGHRIGDTGETPAREPGVSADVVLPMEDAMGKANDTEAGKDPDIKPWERPGQSAQDPEKHPPPPPERKNRHNETA